MVEHLINDGGVRITKSRRPRRRRSTYLTLAGGAGRVRHVPRVPAEAGDARGVQARLPDVVRQVVGQAGVSDAARAALALGHRRVLARQHGANQRPAVDLPLLQGARGRS